MPPENLTAASLLTTPGVPSWVAKFAHAPNHQVRFGPGVAMEVGQLVADMKVHRVLVVTDPGLAATGHLRRVVASLEKAGLVVGTFTEVRENPTTHVVDACVAAARRCDAQALIGLGGGSSMDAAKGCNFILTNGGRMQDYWGVGKATLPMLPFIAIPTTAGTGSECQSFALISDAETHAKMACGDKKAAACLALLDPELTVTQPAMVTRLTGIDAMAHALESAVSTKSNEISLAYSLAAFSLLAVGFPVVLADPTNLRARSQMLLGAALAGVAIENSMLGAAHAAANPLTAQFQLVHGEAVGVMMPRILRCNLLNQEARSTYQKLAEKIGLQADDLPRWFENLLELAGLPDHLRHWGIGEAHVPALAAEAAQQWTAMFNPAAVVEEDFRKFYTDTLSAALPFSGSSSAQASSH